MGDSVALRASLVVTLIGSENVQFYKTQSNQVQVGSDSDLGIILIYFISDVY